ncbi:MAG: hypothetical protein ACOYNY_36820 [Caldilineaceae bacterium]
MMTPEERIAQLEAQMANLLQRLDSMPASLEPQGSFLAVDRASFTSVTLPNSGATEPKAKINLEGLAQDEEGGLINGIAWASDEPQNYGIYRTPGIWTDPYYQQLRISWRPGIILDPGPGPDDSPQRNYRSSYVDIRGKVIIGREQPTAEMLLVKGNATVDGDINAAGIGILKDVIAELRSQINQVRESVQEFVDLRGLGNLDVLRSFIALARYSPPEHEVFYFPNIAVKKIHVTESITAPSGTISGTAAPW